MDNKKTHTYEIQVLVEAHLRGLDMATLNLRGSVTKPSLPCLLHLTVDMMITSASLPCIAPHTS